MNTILLKGKLLKVLCLLFTIVFPFSACSSTLKSTPSSTEETSTILTAEDIYSHALSSTVEITAINSNFSSTGTGFFDDINGTVITNYHVIEDAKQAKIKTYGGKEYDILKVLGYDEQNDIAILSTSCTSSTPLVKSSTSVVTGQKVYALGSSLGLTGTFSEGIVSTASRDIDGTNYIQITAPISHGNSGGPLLNEQGEVIGITSAGFVDGQNLNLAIPIQNVAKVPRNKSLSLLELFNQTPAIERVIDYIDTNGNQEILCGNNTTLTIAYGKEVEMFFIYLTTWASPTIKQSLTEISMSSDNYNICDIYYYYSSGDWSANDLLPNTPVSSISNSPVRHKVSIDPNGISYNMTQADILRVQQSFNYNLACIIEYFDDWLISRELPCNIRDFGFNVQ